MTENQYRQILDPEIGTIISYYGNSVAVQSQAGQIISCYLRRNQNLPVVGDKVKFKRNIDQSGQVLEILPRQSLLSRGDNKSGKPKPIAANIDYVIIVMSPPPIFSEYLIDRYLIAAELLKIKPIINLNKID